MAGYEEANTPSRDPRPAPRAIEPGGAKMNMEQVTTFIDRNSQENLVCLSPRLKVLIAQVGGCQTEHVEAVIKRVMFEILNQIQKW